MKDESLDQLQEKLGDIAFFTKPHQREQTHSSSSHWLELPSSSRIGTLECEASCRIVRLIGGKTDNEPIELDKSSSLSGDGAHESLGVFLTQWQCCRWVDTRSRLPISSALRHGQLGYIAVTPMR